MSHLETVHGTQTRSFLHAGVVSREPSWLELLETCSVALVIWMAAGYVVVVIESLWRVEWSGGQTRRSGFAGYRSCQSCSSFQLSWTTVFGSVGSVVMDLTICSDCDSTGLSCQHVLIGVAGVLDPICSTCWACSQGHRLGLPDLTDWADGFVGMIGPFGPFGSVVAAAAVLAGPVEPALGTQISALLCPSPSLLPNGPTYQRF